MNASLERVNGIEPSSIKVSKLCEALLSHSKRHPRTPNTSAKAGKFGSNDNVGWHALLGRKMGLVRTAQYAVKGPLWANSAESTSRRKFPISFPDGKLHWAAPDGGD